MLKHAPIYVWVLRVGKEYFYESGSGSSRSVLRAFLSEVECLDYKITDLKMPDLVADVVELGELWENLDKLHFGSVDKYNANLLLEVDGEILWNPEVELH